MKATVAGLVTPHLLRVIDLANEAEKGINVAWHVRDSVAKTMAELAHQFNASALAEAFIQGLESAAGNAAKNRTAYIGVLESAADAARRLKHAD